jgi:predicted ATP-grasp superfamily ATP-dependent carboligase
VRSLPADDVAPLIEIIVPYLHTLRYHGIFGAEWKQDCRTGDYKLLEVNARPGWYNTQIVACGVNHVLMAYQEAHGQTISPQRTYQSDVHGLYFFFYDLVSLKNLWLKGQLAMQEVIDSFRAPRDWLVFAQEDPIPFITHLRQVIPLIRGALATDQRERDHNQS